VQSTGRSKPKVERAVPYVRRNFFAGEEFADLADVRRRAEAWCTATAGMRTHGTTQCDGGHAKLPVDGH